MLEVIQDLGTSASRASIVLVRCDCGTEKVMRVCEVYGGRTKSCGCWKRKRMGNLNLRHGEARVDGAASTPEWRAWSAMISRCEATTWRDYANYGGRGIRVCDRWRGSFEAFIEDMGRRPSPGHSLDRIDVNGNYEPDNCRWATLEQQANNKRNSAFITAFGKTLTVAQWSRETGLTQHVIQTRKTAGWAAERILTAPLRITKNTRRPAKEIPDGPR